MEVVMPERFAYCVPQIKRKVRDIGNANVLAKSHTSRMPKRRKTDQDLHDLNVDFVPRDLEIPQHFLRQWREYKGLSQDDLAGLLGTTKSVISGFERDRELSQSWLWRISTALRIRPGYILEHDPASLPADIIEIWGTIPEENREIAERQLKAFIPDKAVSDG